MTTTIDLDADVERMLLKQMELSNKSLQETINATLRTGLSQNKELNQKPPPYAPHFLELKEGIDPLRIRQFADDLADEEFLEKMNRTEPL